MIGLYIAIYILIGVFAVEIIANVSPDVGRPLDGFTICLVLCFWPLCIYVAISVAVVYGVMSLGAWLGKLIRRTFIEKGEIV